MPDTPRVRMPRGVWLRDSARIVSAKPGASRSSTSSVASGVTSSWVSPVPPVVKMKRTCSSSANRRRAAAISPRSSVTASRIASSPAASHSSASAAPDSSSSRRARELEIVKTAALTAETLRGSSGPVHLCGVGDRDRLPVGDHRRDLLERALALLRRQRRDVAPRSEHLHRLRARDLLHLLEVALLNRLEQSAVVHARPPLVVLVLGRVALVALDDLDRKSVV